ncbi:hypothetical protein AYI68_g2696 [Smittium mucronatum]|uniref:Uncharacterized protein n=1 Tax=Smittium mucronatum TaxID=133383 RepID=A0A1R0H1Z4_9FUNG|nr:hypothetical protein AYI68_g2696 [Smittium mucronatum]
MSTRELPSVLGTITGLAEHGEEDGLAYPAWVWQSWSVVSKSWCERSVFMTDGIGLKSSATSLNISLITGSADGK